MDFVSDLEFLGNEKDEDTIRPQVAAEVNSDDSTSLLVQDLVLLTDLIGISELITMLRSETTGNLEQMLLNQMKIDQSKLIRDYVVSKPNLSLTLSQQPNAMCFLTCMLSLFGIKSLSLDQPTISRFNSCKFTFEMDECPETAEKDLRAVAHSVSLHF